MSSRDHAPTLRAALEWLTFCARTSGGTAAPDPQLMDACDQAEFVLSGSTVESSVEVEKVDPRRRDADGLPTLAREVRGYAQAGGTLDLSERDALVALADRAETLRTMLTQMLDGSEGPEPPRFDLALGACQVAAKTDQIDVANAFAQTAIDFLTGNYDPANFDLEDEVAEAVCGRPTPPKA